MASHRVQAERLRHSDKDPDYNNIEEQEVERSYNENASGNAQAAVDQFMHNMDFLKREGDLVYVVPKGAAICMHSLISSVAPFQLPIGSDSRLRISNLQIRTHLQLSCDSPVDVSSSSCRRSRQGYERPC